MSNYYRFQHCSLTIHQSHLKLFVFVLLFLLLSLLIPWQSQPASAATLNVPARYETIQDAIRVAQHDDTILVAPGEYRLFFDNLTIVNTTLTLKSSHGPQKTTLSGRATKPVITIESSSNVVIDGFTITSRNATEGDPTIMGGGIFIKPGSSPVIKNNILFGNISSYGGAIYCDTESSPHISNNLFRKNKALVSGGGIFSIHSKAIIVGNRFEGNETANSGGAIATVRDSSLITNNILWNNRARFGGAISCDRAASMIANNTIVGNHADYGGGILVDKGSVRLNNLILWQNKDDDLFLKQTAPPTRPTYSNIQDGSFKGINGNISIEPNFVAPDQGNFHLQPKSACINSGTDDMFYIDLDGSRNDMGAHGGPKAPQSLLQQTMEKHE